MIDSSKDYVDQQVRHERELRELEARKSAVALILQAAEYERRLGNLNGEHDRAKELIALTVPRELYDRDRTQNDNRLRAVERNQAMIAGGLIVLEVILRLIHF